jgi:hypothetical protein
MGHRIGSLDLPRRRLGGSAACWALLWVHHGPTDPRHPRPTVDSPMLLLDYAAVLVPTLQNRRAALPGAAFALGLVGLRALWSQATQAAPLQPQGAPHKRTKPTLPRNSDTGQLHSHGGVCHAHDVRGGCGDAHDDREAEAAFRQVLRSLWRALLRNQAGLGGLVVAFIASIIVRTWAAVKRAQATGVLAGHFASLRWPAFFRSHATLVLVALPAAVLNAGGNFLEKRALPCRAVLRCAAVQAVYLRRCAHGF